MWLVKTDLVFHSFIIIFCYYFWHPSRNPVDLIVTVLIPCFLCLMKNSQGLSRGSSSCRPTPDPPSSPWAPVKGRFSSASNKQLQLLILSHGVEATFHPSHLWFPQNFQKIPLAVQWSFSAVSVPSGQGSLAMCSSCRLCYGHGAPLKGTIVHSWGSLCERSDEGELALGPGRKWRWSGSLGDSVGFEPE